MPTISLRSLLLLSLLLPALLAQFKARKEHQLPPMLRRVKIYIDHNLQFDKYKLVPVRFHLEHFWSKYDNGGVLTRLSNQMHTCIYVYCRDRPDCWKKCMAYTDNLKWEARGMVTKANHTEPTEEECSQSCSVYCKEDNVVCKQACSELCAIKFSYSDWADYDAQRLALQHDFDAMFKERIHEEARKNPIPAETIAAPTEMPIE